MRAMLLAAGRGERLRPLTDSTPKSLVKVCGECLIDRHLRMLAAAHVDTVVINLGWLGEQIVAHVGSGRQYGLQVLYSPEYDNVLETGGGIRRALPMLGDDPFWVVNADVYTDMALPQVCLAADVVGHLLLVATPDYKKTGDFDLLRGKVLRGAAPKFTFSGLAMYAPAFFASASDGRFSLAPMLFDAARNGVLEGSLYDGVWEDVGTPERLQQLNNR